MLLTLSVAAQAQYADAGMAKRMGARIKVDSLKLSRAQSLELMADIDGEDYSKEWKEARGWRSAGIAMISGGAVVAAGGAVTTMVGLMTSALGAGIGGAAGAVAGSIGGRDSAQEAGSQGAQAGAQAGKPIITAGLITTFVGLGIHIAGIPITAVSCTKMSRLVDKYNAAQMSMELTPGGVGLCLKF